MFLWGGGDAWCMCVRGRAWTLLSWTLFFCYYLDMVTLKMIHQSQGKNAVKYYAGEKGGHSVEYYLDGNSDTINSFWQGKLAKQALKEFDKKFKDKKEEEKKFELREVQETEIEFIRGKVGSATQVKMTQKGKLRTGLDICYSAPKTVSLAWAMADDDMAKKIQKAHEEAVRKANEYIEKKLVETKSKGGKEIVRAKAVAFACFTHFLSRERDPQLHTHALLLNAVKRDDGEIRAFETKRIFQHQKYLDELYKQELARQMKMLGYEIEWDEKKKNFELKKLKDLIDYFSKRKKQVEKSYEYFVNSNFWIGEKKKKKMKDLARVASRMRGKGHGISRLDIQKRVRNMYQEMEQARRREQEERQKQAMYRRTIRGTGLGL